MYSIKATVTTISLGLLLTTALFGQPSYTYSVIPPPKDFKITATLYPTPQPAGDPAPVSGVQQILYGMSWISEDGTHGVGTGVVAGDNGSQLTVCFTYQNGTYTAIPTPGVNCGVNSGNSNGDFVGTLQVPGDLSSHAFLYHNGEFTLFDNLLPQVFPHPDPLVRSTAIAVNSKGQVLGSTFTSQTSSNAFIGPNTGSFLSYSWLYSNGTVSRLADLGGAYNGATGLNENGDVAGFASTPDPRHYYNHATLSPSTGGIIDLGTAGGNYSMASMINAKGQMVGTTSLPSDSPSHPLNHPFFYDNGAMTIMVPDAMGGAVSLNDSGEAVGSYTLESDPKTGHQFYYKDGQVAELSTLVQNLPGGVTIGGARQITNRGVILTFAHSTDADNSEPITVLLTPVPAQTGSGQ